MSELSDKYFSREELLNIARKNNIAEKHFEEFILRIEKDIQQMFDENQLRLDELGEAAVDFAVDFFNKYDNETRKGHSEEWARLYAENPEDHRHAFHDAYDSIRKTNPHQALVELQLHCKAVGGDNCFTRYFIYLMENGCDLEDMSPDEWAASYSNIYKAQIANGRSEIFAHHYADNMADGSTSEAFSYTYANVYDTTIKFGKSHEYASTYANLIADFYADLYSSSKNIQYDEYDLYNETRIAGYMKGWEFAKNNQIKNSDDFIAKFEHLYLRTYEAPPHKRQIITDEVDLAMLNRVLEEINKGK